MRAERGKKEGRDKKTEIERLRDRERDEGIRGGGTEGGRRRGKHQKAAFFLPLV
jgi:hypothetical protein